MSITTGWTREFNAAITVCDTKGIVLEMNDKAAKTFEKWGGKALVGQSLIECHPEPARSKLIKMLADGSSNSYTIEKNGVRKLIHQAPWFQEGKMMGLVEISIEIPERMAHHVRKPAAQ